MAKRNIKKIAIGLGLIALAIFSAITAFYQLEVKPELAQRQKATSITKALTASESISSRSPEVEKQIQKPTVKPTPPKVVKEEPPKVPVKLTSRPTPPVEKPPVKKVSKPLIKHEGDMWYDKGAAQLIITLGTEQGVASGDSLIVYDEDQDIGEVKVIEAFDVISYVQPREGSLNQFEGSYFRVVTKIAPETK